MIKQLLFRTSTALLLAGLAAHAPAQAPTQDASAKAQEAYDPRNFDGVWKLAQGGKFGPVKEQNGVKYVEYPFTPEYQAIYAKRLADAAAGTGRCPQTWHRPGPGY